MTLPPPYRSYSFKNASKSDNADPYMSPPVSPRSSTSSGRYSSSLPAFDSPPKYSQRLREIVERNGQPTHLDLNKTTPQQQPVVVVEKPSDHDSYDEKELEPQFDPEQVNLLTATELEEGVLDFDDAYDFTGRKSMHHRRTPSRSAGGILAFITRRKKCHRRSGSKFTRWQRKISRDDRELSWLTFIGIALFVFLFMTICGVFVAWTAGGQVSPSDLMNKTYWVSSNPQAGVAKVAEKVAEVQSSGEIDIQQLGSHFVIDTYTVEVVRSST